MPDLSYLVTFPEVREIKAHLDRKHFHRLLQQQGEMEPDQIICQVDRGGAYSNGMLTVHREEKLRQKTRRVSVRTIPWPEDN
jgi:hypothetical protein